MTDKPLLAVTIGDPSGIGPEVVAKALQDRSMYEIMRPVLVGTVNVMQKAINAIGSSDSIVGVDSPAEGKNIIRGLLTRGYSDAEIIKITGGNALAFFRRVMS